MYYGLNGNGVAALNGQVACSGGSFPRLFDFVQDFAWLWDTAGKYSFSNKNLSYRNEYSANGSTPRLSTNGVVNNTTNDIAMTVLPNAPIDSATGLPIPTIAVATNSGISIIENDGTVTSSASNTTYRIHEVNLLSTGELYHRQGSGSNEGVNYNNPYSRISGVNLGTYANSTTFWYAVDGVGNASNILGNSAIAPNCIVATEKSTFHVGDAQGLSNILVNSASVNNGMVNWVTKDYATGWMNGDIKLATLSDTDAADVTGTQLITNGTFDSDSNWAKENSTVTISGGTLNFTNSGSDVDATQIITTEVGKTYVATYEVTSRTSGQARLYARDSSSGTWLGGYGFRSSTGPVTLTFTAIGTTTTIYVYAISGPATFSVDNVSVRLAEEDRSINGNGLQVFGTVKKTPVAAGADLVAYSGFSSSNYLRQPYNSDLDFGTGDYSAMAWVKFDDLSEFSKLFVRISESTPYYSIGIRYSKMRVLHGSSEYLSTATLNTGVWTHLAYTKSGSNINIYINGKLDSTHSGVTASVTNTTAVLTIGNDYSPNAQADLNGSMTLLRISGTAPSTEQIKKMYEDEKVLFQENAKATLYGTSDAVTALAYDDSTELLHVGTSAGRSVFQGLRRVDNTTDAVGTAISAVNGLVVEE
jgi:hypothetical protein